MYYFYLVMVLSYPSWQWIHHDHKHSTHTVGHSNDVRYRRASIYIYIYVCVCVCVCVCLCKCACEREKEKKLDYDYLGSSVQVNLFLIHMKDSCGCPRGVLVKTLDCSIVVSEFVFQSRYSVHFSGKYPWERCEPPHPSSYELNINTTLLLGEWLWN